MYMFGSKYPKKNDIAAKIKAVQSIPADLAEDLTFYCDGIKTRLDADSYAMSHFDEICKIYDDVVVRYKQAIAELTSDGDAFWTECLTPSVDILKSSYRPIIAIADREYERSKVYYYTHAELSDLKSRSFSNKKSAPCWPSELGLRLCDDALLRSYTPDEALVKKCSRILPNVTPDVVLKGICLGDYIGEPYESLGKCNGYDPSAPFDMAYNCFTDDSVMALAIYDACSSIVANSRHGVMQNGIDIKAYKAFTESMRYYALMQPLVGYGPRFYAWAVNGADNYDSWANGGAMRSGTIGAFFNKIEEVIKYAIVSAFPSHSHPAGEKAAVLTAVCVWLANHGATKDEIMNYFTSKTEKLVPGDSISTCFDKAFDLSMTPDGLVKASREGGTHTVAGITTVSEALINFIASGDVMVCISNAMRYPCDADTVAAISGGIAAAYYGEVPYIDDMIKKRNDDLQQSVRFVLKQLAEL